MEMSLISLEYSVKTKTLQALLKLYCGNNMYMLWHRYEEKIRDKRAEKVVTERQVCFTSTEFFLTCAVPSANGFTFL